jgi:hypothetical protein
LHKFFLDVAVQDSLRHLILHHDQEVQIQAMSIFATLVNMEAEALTIFSSVAEKKVTELRPDLGVAVASVVENWLVTGDTNQSYRSMQAVCNGVSKFAAIADVLKARNVLKRVLAMLSSDDENLVQMALLTIANLVECDVTIVPFIVERNGLSSMMNLLRRADLISKWGLDEPIIECVSKACYALFEEPLACAKFESNGGVPLLVDAIQEFDSGSIWAFRCVARLAPYCTAKLVQGGALEIALKASLRSGLWIALGDRAVSALATGEDGYDMGRSGWRSPSEFYSARLTSVDAKGVRLIGKPMEGNKVYGGHMGELMCEWEMEGDGLIPRDWLSIRSTFFARLFEESSAPDVVNFIGSIDVLAVFVYYLRCELNRELPFYVNSLEEVVGDDCELALRVLQAADYYDMELVVFPMERVLARSLTGMSKTVAMLTLLGEIQSPRLRFHCHFGILSRSGWSEALYAKWNLEDFAKEGEDLARLWGFDMVPARQRKRVKA